MDFICPYTCSYRTSSGYCGSTGGWGSCQYRQLHQPNTVVGYVPPLKRTNADSIRAMTDEEIENWFWWMHKEMMRYTDSRVFVHNWLRQEVDE